MKSDEKIRSGGMCSGGAVALAFLGGGLIGACAALLVTPESGAVLRKRLLRGAKTAQDELAEMATETREAVEALGKDARQALKRTATRFNTAIETTKEAIKAGPGSEKEAGQL
jgi:gas vesicle protein